MRITGRQLRRIIQEEVARMISEEDVSNVTFTQPAVVKGQAPGALPQGISPDSIGKNIARRLCMVAAKDWNADNDILFSDGDVVSVVGKIVEVSSSDYGSFSRAAGVPEPKEFGLSPRISITSVSVDGTPYAGPRVAELRGKPGTLPPESQMDVTVTFTVPVGFERTLYTSSGSAPYLAASKMLEPILAKATKVS